MNWQVVVERILQDAQDNVWHRLIVSGAGGLVAVLIVAGFGALRRRRTAHSPQRPEAARALRDQGEYHVQLKHRHEAMELFDLSVRLNPRDGHVHYLRGCLYAELGDPDRAIADLTRCLARLPQHRDAERKLAQLGGEHAQPVMPRLGFLWGTVALLLLIAIVCIILR